MIEILAKFQRNFNIGIFITGQNAAQGKIFIIDYWFENVWTGKLDDWTLSSSRLDRLYSQKSSTDRLYYCMFLSILFKLKNMVRKQMGKPLKKSFSTEFFLRARQERYSLVSFRMASRPRNWPTDP